MTGSRTLEARAESRPSDPYLYAAHDVVNVVVLLFVLGDGPGLPMHRCRVLAERIGAQVGRQTRTPRGAVTWLLLPRAIAPPTAAAS